ncbi:hypothetical protein [Nonomuraea sp. NPDC003804]|uniref:hypothetical protein n=1 Tax=Nonomuraea sp. NPDC003804 TaxID=3154547 RepID=UPI0033B84016
MRQAEEQQRLLGADAEQAEQAEKIRQILLGETKRSIKAERRRQWGYILADAVWSVPVGVAINLVVP